MGPNLVEYGPVELFNAGAEASVRCVEDFVRLGRVGALGFLYESPEDEPHQKNHNHGQER
jgi:hypothetical protein